jgi:hypothetical protein
VVREFLDPRPLLLLRKLGPTAHIDLAAVEVVELEMVRGNDEVATSRPGERRGRTELA